MRALEGGGSKCKSFWGSEAEASCVVWDIGLGTGNDLEE